MAGPPIDRIPLYVTMLPALGIVAWLAVGKVGLGLLALVLPAVLLGNVVAAVHHAEVVALRVGEPHGRLVLARRLRQNYGGCGQVRRPTVQDPSRRTHCNKFRHHEAATDRFGRPAEHRCGPQQRTIARTNRKSGEYRRIRGPTYCPGAAIG